MKIPNDYIGYWRGEIADKNRGNNYDGEIVISKDSVKTTYFMKQGDQVATPTLLFQEDGFLILSNDVSGFTLLIYLDALHNLKCVWRDRSTKLGFSSEATMTRI